MILQDCLFILVRPIHKSRWLPIFLPMPIEKPAKQKLHLSTEQVCGYTSIPTDKSIRVHYWDERAATTDDGFSCAFNMEREYHFIRGNIYDKAWKVMCCEFVATKTKRNGTSSYNAIADAVMTCERYVESRIFRFKWDVFDVESVGVDEDESGDGKKGGLKLAKRKRNVAGTQK